jgi:PAS domain S-box-containing protein
MREKADLPSGSGRLTARVSWFPAIKAALLYFGASLLWFGVLEGLADSITEDAQQRIFLKSLVGLFFVILTAILISLIVRRELFRLHKTQVALRDSESRKAAILESALDSIITIDHTGRILEVNAAAERTFGFTREEMIGQEMARLIIPEQHRSDHRDGLREYLATGNGPVLGRRIEMTALRKGGKEFPVELAISAIAHEGEPVFTGTLRDITERKRTEQALQEARASMEKHARELEATVAARTSSLREMIDELESFSYSLSHDMRAPLRTMQSFSQLLLIDYQNKIGAEGQDYLKRIASASERLDRLINDMLGYSRLVQKELTLGSIDLDRLVREIIAERPNLQPYAPQIDIQSPLLPVHGHSAALTQCLSNLLENAVKFVDPGVRARVKVWTELRNGQVRLWVEDNGIGIPERWHEKIFGMFQRLHSTEMYSGTGIGLTIARKAVQRMGGQMGLDSEPDQGSRFWIQLGRG